MGKMKIKWDGKYVRALFLFFVFVSISLAVGLWLLGQQGPTLGDVLSRNTGNNYSDLPLFVASMLALSLATVTAARGYEVFKNCRSAASVVVEDEGGKKLEGLERNIKELGKVKEWMKQENVGLKERLAGTASEFEELRNVEKMLRKSNISLSKECERLKSENEMLMLKINSLKIKPKRTTGKIKSKAKAKSKAKGKTKKKA